jgi:hypothetical protein
VDATALAHAAEDASLVVKVGWCVHLGNLALVHDADAIVVDDSLESVGYAEQSLRDR